MARTVLLMFGLLLLAVSRIGLAAVSCPTSSRMNTVFSSNGIAALSNGNVTIKTDTDIQCFNYTFPHSFLAPPQVAIALHGFETQRTDHMFFYIKPLLTYSLTSVSFVIRTQAVYTQWIKLSFNFLAEDRDDMESGYYQVDSGELAGCNREKSITILLPFRTQFTSNDIKYQVFLHGFEISTIRYNDNVRSPFEVHISQSSVSISGITLGISVQTATQVNSIYVSYLAYQNIGLNIMGGSYVFDQTLSDSMRNQLDQPVASNYAQIYGLTGFIINYQAQPLVLTTTWNGISFSFDLQQSSSSTQYLSFQYALFTGSRCQQCQGYQRQYNQQCVNMCPVGTYTTLEGLCISCDAGQAWNGNQCVIQCPQDQYFDATTNQCQCPLGRTWSGSSCIQCTAGRVFMQQTQSCECGLPLKWNGLYCALVADCTQGRQWDVDTSSCRCPDDTIWNGTFCDQLMLCSGGRISNNNQCVCPQQYSWNGQQCDYSPCSMEQIWQGTQCVCPVSMNFNGAMCVQCKNGLVWEESIKQCMCEDGYRWSGQFCQQTFECSGEKVWNATFNQCVCRSGDYWNGYVCLPVPNCYDGQYWDSTVMKCVCNPSSQWNGNRCIYCLNGQYWNATSLTCACPSGTIENQNGCQIQQVCTGGKVFRQNTFECECPEHTVWNGQLCIMNPCTSGMVWNAQYRSCECPGDTVWINQRCVPPQISCTNGKVWNPDIYACECPAGTYAKSTQCELLPVCQNGMNFSSLTNQCTCPYGMSLSNDECRYPSCPDGQFWNSYECQIISCPPPTYFLDGKCTTGDDQNCGHNSYWNGVQCVFSPILCPQGTTWNSLECQSDGSCDQGFYSDTSLGCQPLPQPCIPPAVWIDSKCSVQNNQCPSGTYASGGQCLPSVECQNGLVWSLNQLKCICQPYNFYNGRECISCSKGQEWVPKLGCTCPEGTFDTGSFCERLDQTKCTIIPNSIWDQQKCKCRPGFTKLGLQCVCQGTLVGFLCDKCSFKPHSEWNESTRQCKCVQGYTEISQNCIPHNQVSLINQGSVNQVGPNNQGSLLLHDSPGQCNAGSYFDNDQKRCLACPEGCLSCFDSYRCKVCHPRFTFDSTTQQCIQICGDGLKFVLECDDGNNGDIDGCSRDCKIESGYTCTGGSPDSKDNCFLTVINRVSIRKKGVIRKSTSIVLNVEMNYIPNSLLSSIECSNSCSRILFSNLVDGDTNAVSVLTKYVTGTRYLFTVEVEFGRPYIGQFKIQIGIRPSLLSQYFAGMLTPNQTFTVSPAYLARVSSSRQDILS